MLTIYLTVTTKILLWDKTMKEPQGLLPTCNHSLVLCYSGYYFIPLYYKYTLIEIPGRHHRVLLKITQYIYEVISNILTGAPCGQMSL